MTLLLLFITVLLNFYHSCIVYTEKLKFTVCVNNKVIDDDNWLTYNY